MVDAVLWLHPKLADKHDCLKCQVFCNYSEKYGDQETKDHLASVEMTTAERGKGRKPGKYDISVLWELRQNYIVIYLCSDMQYISIADHSF